MGHWNKIVIGQQIYSPVVKLREEYILEIFVKVRFENHACQNANYRCIGYKVGTSAAG
jgi:hypothetical protein